MAWTTWQYTTPEQHVVSRHDTVEPIQDSRSVNDPEVQAWIAAGNTPLPAAPPPIVFSENAPLAGQVHTTDATPTEVLRITLAPQTGYTGQVSTIGVDSGNGAVRVLRVSFAIKRLNGGALSVGAPVVLASHGDAAAASWAITMSVPGNDAVISVTGAAGRNVDWVAQGEIMSFAPGGVS